MVLFGDGVGYAKVHWVLRFFVSTTVFLFVTLTKNKLAFPLEAVIKVGLKIRVLFQPCPSHRGQQAFCHRLNIHIGTILFL